MRGLIKAAALLSSTLASAFVIPESVSIRPSGGVIEYRPSEAFLKFAIANVESNVGLASFTFQVGSVNKACGESNIKINGQQLDSQWDGTEATGHDYLAGHERSEAFWSITCLYDSTPTDGSFSNGEDVTHLLHLRLHDSAGRQAQGFTISYKQLGVPEIVRFKPIYVEVPTAGPIASLWRKPSVELDPDMVSHVHHGKGSSTMTESLNRAQKSLGSSFKAFEGFLKNKVDKVVEKLGTCYKDSVPAKAMKASPNDVVNTILSDKLLEAPPDTKGQSTSTVEALHLTSTKASLSAAETRSLTISGDPQAPVDLSSSPSASNPSHRNFLPFKILALAIIVFSFFAWVYLCLNDPRRRADRASRREERRTKRLYRRAAQHQKMKKWFWNFRLRHGLASIETISWDEKRARVIEQENVLENVMKDDIRALRNAHRVVSSITAAEEGRSGTLYEVEGTGHRCSFATLPPYERESGQPPSYDGTGDNFDGSTVVDGFGFTPADTEFTSDSSVISTSPRISRDGTNSDFDEKFEPLSLATSSSSGRSR